jgi:hypothetical protein
MPLVPLFFHENGPARTFTSMNNFLLMVNYPMFANLLRYIEMAAKGRPEHIIME